MSSRAAFDNLVLEELLPQFSAHYGYDTAGFRAGTLKRVSEDDATWFLEALRTRVVSRDGPFFRSVLSRAREQIFWQGVKSVSPRPITMWVEPVITIAGAGRLHGRFGWPRELIGLQSERPWAFDLVGYDPEGKSVLVCEVKKSRREVDRLVRAMLEFLSQPPLNTEPTHQAMRNAYRKVKALRQVKPRLVWVLGPESYGKVFQSVRGANGEITQLEEVGESALSWRAGLQRA